MLTDRRYRTRLQCRPDRWMRPDPAHWRGATAQGPTARPAGTLLEARASNPIGPGRKRDSRTAHAVVVGLLLCAAPWAAGDASAASTPISDSPAAVEVVDRPWTGARQGRPPAVLPVAPREVLPGAWAVVRGRTLKNTLDGWTAQAGWLLDWRVEADFEVGTGAVWRGDFGTAVRGLMNAISPQHGLGVQMLAGNTPPILVVHRIANPGKAP